MHEQDIIDRFFDKVNQSSSCWLWTAGLREKDGYGCMDVYGKLMNTHRLSWEIHHGEIPDSLHVLHKCDIKRCVNPSHLFLGTQDDNNKDRANKDRSWKPKGEEHPMAKLNDIKVREIRRLYKAGSLSQYKLADIFNVSQQAINLVVNNKRWGHVI